uniref:B30.2/SPRY domain-containing protein n=1 Tax=Alexandrium andersonii TaxID=327968 RepID=A0A7S2N5M6_9DINO
MGVATDRTRMPMDAAGALRAIESDALVEPSFRRLLSAIEGERERIRATWQQIQQEREGTAQELERLRQDTEDWCQSEKMKIDAEWKRLDKLSEQMNDMWPSETEIIEINCSGTIFTTSRSSLCSIEGSVLSRVFSDEFIAEVPRDEMGRFFLDFNPACFGIVIEYLQNRRLRLDAPLPVIPGDQQHNMELLAEAWKLSPFLHENRINPVHTTSMLVQKNTVEATHPGWQVISSQHPLPMAGPSYFEVSILKNPDPRGGLAIGFCRHIPAGMEIHSIRLHGSVLYNSNNGLIGDIYDNSDVPDKIQLVEGSTFGIKHDVATKSLLWYANREYLGKAQIKSDPWDQVRTLYPVFALYVPGLTIQVNFSAPSPSATVPQDAGAAS